jgi:hypothetical protein
MARSGKDLTGRHYGKLTALEVAGRDRGGNVLWKCQCECGNIRVCRSGELGEGKAISCGCHSKHTTRRGRAIAGLDDAPIPRRPEPVFTEIHNRIIYGR